MQSYTRWLAGELEALWEPADLVGHDLGGVAVAGVAMVRPDLVRTWVNDVLGIFDPDYAWHELAQVCQTPGDGEKMAAGLIGGTLAERTSRLTAPPFAFSGPVAARVAAAQGPDMGRALLAFYRSAVQPAMAEAGRDLPLAAKRPGLAVIDADGRNTGSVEMRQRTAGRAQARTAILDGLGHWWMTQDPARSARTLGAFWAETR
jgi:pimeloyl-ACP methyl ester carboxylesterase